jgi:hypothetical protein
MWLIWISRRFIMAVGLLHCSLDWLPPLVIPTCAYRQIEHVLMQCWAMGLKSRMR